MYFPGAQFLIFSAWRSWGVNLEETAVAHFKERNAACSPALTERSEVRPEQIPANMEPTKLQHTKMEN